ncbi:MAG: hypothetical protein ACO21B_10010, partial [Gemmobacter sp.]
MRAYLFPGQGAQTVGMGRALAEAYPAARAVFEAVDEALGEPLSTLIWEGPIETLTLTAATIDFGLSVARFDNGESAELSERERDVLRYLALNRG